MQFFILILGAFFAGIGFLIHEGNAKYLLAGYNTMGESERKKVDLSRFIPYFRRFHIFLGASFTVLGLLLVQVQWDLLVYNLRENEVGEVITEDYYGFAKYLISQRCKQLDHVSNLRFFNVFGPTTPNDMFTTVNIKNYIHKREIVIFKDKYMDFFGIEDTKKVVDLYLKGRKSLPKDINFIYLYA